ncbi:MAG: GGDEF domain-containing protein [Sulfuricurvum sp.]|uniref:GGDEF domain-containing protein n=1 Tax=Sulfuricurvum sp. TaxID=2025608 RepID=UPI0025EA04AE|nr:GGDEF domain-containing protein [Sulfuricurvum sp.]MCK9373800.1 GGDEF domain-containing protein [Sulfuricurvum sp.]
MSTAYEDHIAITTDIKKTIEPLNVVLPAYYGKLYAQFAKKYQIELKPDELLNPEMLNEQMLRHIITLAECTDSAIKAIETQNTFQLQTILAETKKLRAETDTLRKMVYIDNLTHAYNRKWFDDTILDNDGVSMSKEGILVIVDLNKFKHINDTYGHTIGDKVLVHIAHKLRTTGGEVVRYGGDEFIVLFNSDPNDAKLKMENALTYFQKTHFKINSHAFKACFAYGIAPFAKGSIRSTIIDQADSAMYRHKQLASS